MASFLEDIRNDLVCRICEGHTRPGKKHWYRCMRLHQICQDCKGKNEKCSCEEPISKEYCKMTEKWLNVEGLKFNCVNTKSGCQETHAKNGLENHESECIYRLVSCPSLTPGVEDCESKVAFQDIIHHFEKHHFEIEELDLSKNHTVKTSTDIDASGVYIYGDLLKCIFKNRTFLLTSMTSEDEDVFYFWVYLLGSRNEAKHFSYTLKLINNKSEMSFKGKVAAIDECFDNVITNGNCFAVPEDVYIAHFHEFSLEIRNLKEEVQDDNYESGISDNEEESKE